MNSFRGIGTSMIFKIKLVTLFSLCMLISPCRSAAGYYPVSITQLVATPSKYVDKKIRVKGYLKPGIYLALYPNHLAADISDRASAVKVIDQTKRGNLSRSCNNKYVTLSGRFTKYKKGYEIIDVVEVLDAKTLESCWHRKESAPEN